MDAKLVVVSGEAKAGEVKIKKLPTVVGRGDEADIRLRHPLVSRKHCEIFESDGVLKVRDLGSLNGTFIANAKIEESVLKPDELITIGPVVFRAVYEGPAGVDADDELSFGLDDADVDETDVMETQPMNLTKTASLRETVSADDISLDDFEIDEAADDKPAAAAAVADDDDFGDLDFDLDDGDGDKPAAAATADVEVDDDDEFADLLSVDDAEFDIDLDDEPAIEEPAAKKPAKQEAKSKSAASDEVEFDIDSIDDDDEIDDFLSDIGIEK